MHKAFIVAVLAVCVFTFAVALRRILSPRPAQPQAQTTCRDGYVYLPARTWREAYCAPGYKPERTP